MPDVGYASGEHAWMSLKLFERDVVSLKVSTTLAGNVCRAHPAEGRRAVWRGVFRFAKDGVICI